MNQQRFFAAVLSALEACGIPYMVAGSVASILYGEPRLTNDMDVVVELDGQHVDGLLEQLAVGDFYLPSAEFIREVIARGGAFNIIDPASASKVDLIVRRRTEFGALEFARRRRLPFDDRLDASVATPEDVIVSKLVFFAKGESQKHLRDIAGILRVSAGRLDEAYIDEWVTRLGLRPAWEAARRLAAEPS